ncbi:MAG: hypothetical protein BJ554DRAFT_3912 [Olpidium bornovanus]|uniref:ER membrane protein complex subunit 2 n=1 Tax=Olpidium bornovanus TaxID=278681 RepID=A0A8H8DFL3_9FUNG|nr:MAG: hypothetical protein BJ554DRAFT_3912 [Olpidium bornovanus]
MPYDDLNTSPAGLREAWRRAAALNNPERTGGLADAIVARGLDGRLGDDSARNLKSYFIPPYSLPPWTRAGWNFYEQAFIAAMDTGKKALADVRFRPSAPQDVLPGANWLESQGKYEDAHKVYRDILKEDETNIVRSPGRFPPVHPLLGRVFPGEEGSFPVRRRLKLVTKRVICLAKAKGKTTEAIAALVKFLDVVYNDQEAWMELSDLYAKEHMCILYTMGQFGTALKTYCRVLELTTDHVRALYGLKLV